MNKQEKTSGKQSKREQVRAERRRRSLVWNIIVLGGSGLVLVLVAWYFVAVARPGPFADEQVIRDEGAGHVDASQPLTFLHYPPSSGAHYATGAAWGVYTDTTHPIAEGNYLHNLEQGGVVFLYNCTTNCQVLEQQFQAFYQKAPPDLNQGLHKILVSPYDPAKMPTAIVALAWGHEWDTNTFSEADFLRWYRRFVNQGPK